MLFIFNTKYIATARVGFKVKSKCWDWNNACLQRNAVAF